MGPLRVGWNWTTEAIELTFKALFDRDCVLGVMLARPLVSSIGSDPKLLGLVRN